MPMKLKAQLMDDVTVKRALTRLSYEIIEKSRDLENVVLIGIKTRGVPLAEQIAANIETHTGVKVQTCTLDITFCRDDLTKRHDLPTVNTQTLPVDLNDKEVILVDDVLFTGRTVRAAIDGAAARGCASAEALTARAEYLLEQAVPEAIILRVFAEMFSLPEYPEMVPDPPVRYVQADSFGALTRALAYRLSGLHLRLVGSKGCGKNTLIQTVDWLLNVPQYRMQGNAELDKLDLLGGPTIENGTMRYRLSDMLRYLAAGADVVLDEGNTIKPECADVLHSLTDAARQIQVPGYGLVQMHPHSAFTITMNEDYAGTNFMNEATIDRFTPIHIAEPESIVDVLHRVVPEASAASLNICDYVYCAIRDRIRSAGGLEPDAMTIRGFIDALRAEPLLGLRWGLLDNVASKPQDAYTRLQLTELIESMVPQDGRI